MVIEDLPEFFGVRKGPLAFLSSQLDGSDQNSGLSSGTTVDANDVALHGSPEHLPIGKTPRQVRSSTRRLATRGSPMAHRLGENRPVVEEFGASLRGSDAAGLAVGLGSRHSGEGPSEVKMAWVSDEGSTPSTEDKVRWQRR